MCVCMWGTSGGVDDKLVGVEDGVGFFTKTDEVLDVWIDNLQFGVEMGHEVFDSDLVVVVGVGFDTLFKSRRWDIADVRGIIDVELYKARSLSRCSLDGPNTVVDFAMDGDGGFVSTYDVVWERGAVFKGRARETIVNLAREASKRVAIGIGGTPQVVEVLGRRWNRIEMNAAVAAAE